jgi:hypothetical protein
MIRILLISLLLPVLAACANSPPPPPSTLEVAPRIRIPAELLQQCTELRSLYPTDISGIIQEDLEFIEKYGECRKRHSSLIEAIKDIVQ